MKAGGGTSGVTPFVRMKSAGAALRLLGCLAALCVSVIAIAPLESFAAPASSPSCATGVGVGGPGSATVATTRGGNGCVVIKYFVNGTATFETFNYTGADQTWTVPSGVTSVEFHLIGAGGGGATRASGGAGGGGGYATGTYAVTPGQQFTVIVGEGGGGILGSRLSGCYYTRATYGGGGKGGSCFGGGSASQYSSGGGRTAIRLNSSADDLATAAGGGGGGYGGAGGAGGGTNGVAGTVNNAGGGTQTAGGVAGTSVNGLPGYVGTKYAGGNSRDEGGGGGGGWWGGGGGGDNGGGGGGSSYVAALTGGSTNAGSGTTPGVVAPVNTSAPVITGLPIIGVTLTATSGTWASAGTSTWQWQTSTDGVTYTNVSSQVATTITTTDALYYRVIESRSNLFGSASATSNVIKAVAPVTVSCTPTTNVFTHCQRFNYYGAAQTYTVPSDMPIGSTFTVEVWGGGGGGVISTNYPGGGAGGYVKSTVTIQSPNEVFNVVVGERGEARDTASGYGGGGAGGPSLTLTNNAGSSGGGLSGLFAGSGTATPVVIAGGGGGASWGINTDSVAGGGGAGSGGQGTNAVTSGRAGTLMGGGAAATGTAQCTVTSTAGIQYQGGRGCGTLAANTEGGGGGGGGWYGGGGGNHQTSTSGVQNGGGGGGSGYIDATRTALAVSTTGGQGTVTAPLSGGRTSDQYVATIGSGGPGNATTVAAAAGGHGMIVVQWAVPPTARADVASGGVAMAIAKNPTTNDTGASGATITASSVRLCGSGDVAPNCTGTSRSIAGEGSYSVNTSTGVVTFTGEAGFVGTSTITYSVADTRGTKASSTIAFTTLAPPTARPDESAAPRGDNQSVSPLANDSASGSATLNASSLRICEVSPAETSPACTKTTMIVANEGRYDVSDGVVTFTANANYTGTRLLLYIVQDSNTQVAASTITFSALPPPAVSTSADFRTVGHTATASFTPLSNDSAGITPSDYTTQGSVAFNTSTLKLCASDETISTGCTKTSIDVASQGTWTLSGTTVTFVPLVTFSGIATPITYVVCNTIGGTWAPGTPPSSCGSSTMNVTVNAPTAPAPVVDAQIGGLGDMLSYLPLSNDTGSSLSSSRMRLCDATETAPNCFSTSVAVANEGTWSLNTTTGLVLFVPLALFYGDATPITYTGSDVVGTTFSSTISATIQAPTLPTAYADSASGVVTSDITLSPLNNDTGTGITASSLFLCGTGDTAPTCTELTLTVAGQGVWQVNASSGVATFTPSGGFTGTATATYSVQDVLSRKTSAVLSAVVSAITAPNTPNLITSSDTGSSSTDNVTNDTTPAVRSSGVSDGDTVTITATKGATTVTCTYVESANVSSCDLSSLTEGTWAITSRRVDAQNNASGDSAPLSIVIDSTAPTQPSIPDLDSASDTGSSTIDNNTSDTTPAVGVSGVQTGDMVTMSAVNGGTTVTCTYDTAVATTCDLSTLTDGTWSVTAVVTDNAGNVSSQSSSLSITIDSTIPTTTAPPTTTVPTTTIPPTTTTIIAPTTTTTVPVTTTTTTVPLVTTTTVIATTTVPVTTTTLPNSQIPYVTSDLEKITNDIARVVGMQQGGWVKVDKNATSLAITTSDGLLIQIGAKVKSSVTLRLNSRGMPIFEANDFITIAGGGLMPSTPASTWLFSTPTQLGQLVTDATGSFSAEYAISDAVPAGDHTAQLNGIAPDGTLRVVEVAVEIIASPDEVAPTVSTNESSSTPPATPLDTSSTVALLSSALAILAISRSKSSSSSSSPDTPEAPTTNTDTQVERTDAGGEVASVSVTFGDRLSDLRPDSLRVPRLKWVDSSMNRIATAVDRLSPMLARIADDGAYARTLLGFLWPLLPLMGVALGIASAINTDFTIMIPALSLVLAIAVLGVIDAFAGLLFVLSFGIAMLLGGGFDSVDSIRGYLGIAVFSFAPVMIAAATRPFRRSSTDDQPTWNRCVDFILSSLFGAWAAGSMYGAIPSLTTFKPAHSDRVDLVQVVFIVAIAARWLLENIARLYAPSRLRVVEVEVFDETSLAQRLCSHFIRTAVFVFVAVVFIGNNWALWIGGAMFLAPKIIDEFSDSFRNLPTVHKFLPRNLLRVVLMLFVGLWWGNLVNNQFGDSENVLLYAFVLLSIPGISLGAIDWFAKESDGWKSNMVSKALGIATLIVGILCVRGVIF